MVQEDCIRARAKILTTGKSQTVRLPAAFRFDTKEVYVHRDPRTGDVILSRKPARWDEIFAALDKTGVPADFLADRNDRKP